MMLPTNELSIKTDQLSKTFAMRKALDKLTFTLPNAGFLSVFGANGVGKTTLLRILATLERPTSGTISLFGLDVHNNSDAVREHIGFLSHNSMLYQDLTAEENLLFAAKLYGVANAKERVSELLALVELTARRNDIVRTFSRGMKQRLSIARALIHDPDLLLLDEPYSGLDPRAVAILDDLLIRVRAGRSFVMVSHDLQKGFDVSTHVLVLSKGQAQFFTKTSGVDFDDFAAQYHSIACGGVA
jgi:heme exporter protein A